MKKLYSIIGATLLSVLLFAGCSPAQAAQPVYPAEEGVLVVATNSILADMAENVAGDHAQIYSIVPIGTDPHEYEPLPQDIEAVSKADIVFYNGLNLETGGNGWFSKLMEITDKTEGQDYFVASKGVEPLYLTSAGKENEQDPHAWLDIQNGIRYVETIATVLAEKDPQNKADYAANAAAYCQRLEALDTRAKSEFSMIPAEKKLLVSSEGAFKYFSKAYDLTAAYIWEINTESQGTPEQMTTIIDTIRQWEVPVLFVETSVDPRSMEQIAAETNLPIYATIFTDSLAKKGESGDNYYDMMEWNLEKIQEGLSSD